MVVPSKFAFAMVELGCSVPDRMSVPRPSLFHVTPVDKFNGFCSSTVTPESNVMDTGPVGPSVIEEPVRT